MRRLTATAPCKASEELQLKLDKPEIALAREARLQFLTWERTPADTSSAKQREIKETLKQTAGASIADTAYIAEHARIFTSSLHVGERSWIAGHALVRGDVELGENCSVNAYACISGKVRCGNGVRIASLVSIVGFNHGFDDPDTPINDQPHEIHGITIGDDVWMVYLPSSCASEERSRSCRDLAAARRSKRFAPSARLRQRNGGTSSSSTGRRKVSSRQTRAAWITRASAINAMRSR
jgi:acetyltransferase-like isoleucine patch superfamily enzyme